MTTAHRAPVYRNVELRQQWFGLEPLDAIGLAALFWLLCLVNRDGFAWNAVVGLAAYGGIRVAKRGKPEGHTSAIVRFYLRGSVFSAAAPDTEVAERPFRPA